jgi:hypothetical protein
MVNSLACVIMFVLVLMAAHNRYPEKEYSSFVTGVTMAFLILLVGAVVAILIH